MVGSRYILLLLDIFGMGSILRIFPQNLTVFSSKTHQRIVAFLNYLSSFQCQYVAWCLPVYQSGFELQTLFFAGRGGKIPLFLMYYKLSHQSAISNRV